MTGSDLANIAYVATVLIFVGYGLNLWRTSRAIAKRPPVQPPQEANSAPL